MSRDYCTCGHPDHCHISAGCVAGNEDQTSPDWFCPCMAFTPAA